MFANLVSESLKIMEDIAGNDRSPPRGTQAQAMAYRAQLIFALAWTTIAVTAGLVLWALGDVLLPFLVGAAVAYFLDPAVRRLEACGLPRLIASLGMMLLLMGILSMALFWLVPLVISEAAALSRALPGMFEEAKVWLGSATGEDLDDEDSIFQQVLADAGDALRDNAQALALGLLSGISALINLILFWVVMPVVAFYLLMDWPRLLTAIDKHLPRDQLLTIRRLASEIDETMAGFVRGEVIVVSALMAYYSLTLTLVGLTYGLVIGLVAGLVSFIPYVGAFVGGSLMVGFAFYQFWGDPFWIGAVLVILLIGQFTESQILVPRLVGHSVNLHPVWLIFAIMAFGSLFGLLGVVVAVPVAAALGVLIRFAMEQYRNSRLYRGQALVRKAD